MHAEADVLAREWQGAYAKDKANGHAARSDARKHDRLCKHFVSGFFGDTKR